MTAAQLDRRLLTYSITAGAALAGSMASAAILHTDIDPDQVLVPGFGSYGLDMDGSGNPEFRLDVVRVLSTQTATSGTGSSAVRRIRKRDFNGSAHLLPLTSGGSQHAFRAHCQASFNSAGTVNAYSFVGALPFGHLASANVGGWSSLANQGVGSRIIKNSYSSSHTGGSGWNRTYTVPQSTVFNGVWGGVNEGFFGVKFTIAGQTRYGWIRATVDTNYTQMTLHDFAYQSTPDVPIVAGDVGDVVAEGRETSIEAGVIGGPFTSKPKVYGIYTDPIKDPGGLKPKKATAKVLDKPTVDNPLGRIRCEWKKKVALYDKAAFRAWYKGGNFAELFLQANPIAPMAFDLRLLSKDVIGEVDIPDLILHPPVIDGVYDALGQRIHRTQAGARLTIRGSFFGKKPPKVWLENVTANGIKMLKLKVVKPLAFPDVNGKPEKSVMQPVSGVCELVVQVPDAFPKDWVHTPAGGGFFHDLVIDNGVGIAVYEFDTLP
jgi:hypothetical protein